MAQRIYTFQVKCIITDPSTELDGMMHKAIQTLPSAGMETYDKLPSGKVQNYRAISYVMEKVCPT